MPILQCYVDDETLAILNKIAKKKQRTVEDLAECAISEAVNDVKRESR